MGTEDREETIKLLYSVFRLPDESYIVTVKLLYIYDWVEPEEHEATLEKLKQMRAALKRMSNQRKVDMIYRMAEHARLKESGMYAPSNAKPPVKRQDYISGWLPY